LGMLSLIREKPNSRKPAYRVAALAAAIWALLSFASAGRPQEVPASRRIRVESAFVTVPVIVWDSKGRILYGLGADSFQLYQDGVRVPFSVFLNPEDPFYSTPAQAPSPSWGRYERRPGDSFSKCGRATAR
jgi:hypothetical protein